MLMFKLRVGDIGGEREGGEISSYVKGHRSLPEHFPKNHKDDENHTNYEKEHKNIVHLPGYDRYG